MLDLLLLIIGIGMVVFVTMQRTLRALMLTFIFYVVFFLSGTATLATDLLYRLARAILEVIGSAPPDIKILQVIVFWGLSLLAIGLCYVMIHYMFTGTALPQLGVLDYILGAVLGIVLALVVMSVVYNSWGVVVSERWQPRSTYLAMRSMYDTAFLRPLLRQVMVMLRGALAPFRMMGEYPIIFTLQK